MSFWTDLGNLAGSCIFFVGNIIADTALTVTQYIQKAAGTNVIPDIQKQRVDIQKGLHDINRQLQYFLQKWATDGRRSRSDEDRYSELVRNRDEKKEKLWTLKESEVVGEVKNAPNGVNSTTITLDNPHVVQYHIGQITKFSKACPVCGRGMVLNFARNRDMIKMDELIWTCVSYYNGDPTRPQCPTLPYSHSDIKLFANEKIEEFKCTNKDLATIFRVTQNDVLSRIDQHRNDPVKDYICPIHGTELILRRKNTNVQGALDQYFLACSYYNFDRPNGVDSCRYIVKLKSPAQLASALRQFEGRGIL